MFSCKSWKISHNTFFKEPFGRLLLHKHSLCLLSNHDLLFFQKRCSGWVFLRLEDILKTSWKRLGKTSWRRLENVLQTFQRPMARTNILVWSRRLEDVLSFEDIWVRQIYSFWPRRLEDVLNTSSKNEDKRLLREILKKSFQQDEYLLSNYVRNYGF